MLLAANVAVASRMPHRRDAVRPARSESVARLRARAMRYRRLARDLIEHRQAYERVLGVTAELDSLGGSKEQEDKAAFGRR